MNKQQLNKSQITAKYSTKNNFLVQVSILCKSPLNRVFAFFVAAPKFAACV
jgi:hypothetical protein